MNQKIGSKLTLLLSALSLSITSVQGYEVWYGMPYLEREAATNTQAWENIAPQLQGINANFRDIQRPVEERNTNATWNDILSNMPAARDNAFVAIPRPEFNYEGRNNFRTLEQILDIRFRHERTFGVNVRSLMIYNERPNENLTLPVVVFTDEEIQDVQDWLDNNGQSDVKLFWNVRSNSRDDRLFSEKPVINGILMEGSPPLWQENRGMRQQYLTWALSNPLVQDKAWIMQVPARGISGLSLYEGMRWFMRFIPETLGSFDFFRRDDVAILPITYGPGDAHLPELEQNDTQYGNSLLGFALSIAEQKDLFEGRLGAVSEEQAMSRTRRLSSHEVGRSIDATLFDGESDPGNDSRVRNAGTNIGNISDGTWVRFDDFNLGEDGIGGITVQAATPKTGSSIEVRINSETGPLIGVVRVGNTGGFGTYQNFSNKISSRTGVRDLYLVFRGGSGGLLNLQSFRILPRSASREVVRTENTSRNLVYGATWNIQNEPRDSGGSMTFSNILGAQVSHTFTGDRVKVGVRMGPSGGNCRVLLDGNIVSSFINTQSASQENRTIIYDSGTLFGYGNHTVEVVVLGGGGNVMIDFFETEE